jgi:hypothetical protein
MKRIAALIALLLASSAHAEYREIRQTVFGMD